MTKHGWKVVMAALALAVASTGVQAAPSACDDDFLCRVRVGEFYHRGLDRFFLTADPAELAALDAGAIAGWQPSTGSFTAYGIASPPFDVPVCRFYAPPALGDAHFLTAFADECAALQRPDSGFVVESTAAFYVAMPDAATGACAAGVPIYRLWNPRGGADHRYVIGKVGRDQLVDVLRWYVSEGLGPDGVAFCVVDPSDEF